MKLPRWQNERCKRLHKIFTCIERRMARGWRLHESLVWFAWYYKNRFYRCDPARRFRVSANSLRDAYYRWKRGGRTPESLTLGYRSGRAKLSQAKIAAFLRAAIDAPISSYSAALALCGDSITPSAYTHALPLAIRRPLNQLFSLRRQARHAKRRLVAAIVEYEKDAS